MHDFMIVSGSVLGTALVTLVGYTGKWLRNVDLRLTRIETLLKLKQNED